MDVESEEEDYGTEFEMLEVVERMPPVSSTLHTEVDLDAVWERDGGSDSERENLSNAPSLHEFPSSSTSSPHATSEHVTSSSPLHIDDDVDRVLNAPPKNSLASSSNRSSF